MANKSATATKVAETTNGANEPQSTEPKQKRIRKIDPMPIKVFSLELVKGTKVYAAFNGSVILNAWSKNTDTGEKTFYGSDDRFFGIIESLFSGRGRKQYLIAQFVPETTIDFVNAF